MSENQVLSRSVIICAYTLDRWHDLLAAVESAERQLSGADELLVVIDHNDLLLEKLHSERPDLVVVPNERKHGLSGARNTGIDHSSGDVVVFLDDDATAEEGWLDAITVPFADPEVLGVGGRARPVWDVDRPHWFPAEFLWVVGCSYVGLPEGPASIRNPIGCNMALRRAAVLEVGGFSSDLGRIGTKPVGGEETDLSIRLAQRFGGTIRYEPAALVSHRVTHERERWSYFASRCFFEGRSKAVLASRVGAGDATSSERTYLNTLAAGVAKRIPQAVSDRSLRPLSEAVAIVAGLSATTAGFVTGTLGRKLSDSRSGSTQEMTGRPRGTVDTQEQHVRADAGPAIVNESFTVTAIIATRDRPELLRRALLAISQQSHPVNETIVVFDQSTPDESLVEEFPAAHIRIVTNTHSPGLAGARNSGIEAATSDWVAFCDDDDVWAVDKLEQQFAEVAADPGVDFVVGGITIAYGDRRIRRRTDLRRIGFDDLIRDRVMEAHPSTYLVRRRAIDDYIGLVDEELPGSYAEDYDWLLSAARVRPIAVAPANVAMIQWHPDSYFGNKWEMIDEALAFLLEKTPEFEDDDRGKARIMGQRAYAQAAMGRRAEAWATWKETARLDWRQPRLLTTLAVMTGLVDGEKLVKWANAVGRGV